MKNNLLLLLVAFSLLTFSNCKKDQPAPATLDCTDIEALKSFFTEKNLNEILIIKVEEVGDNYQFDFDNGSSLTLDKSCFLTVMKREQDWEVLFIYNDGTEQTVAYAGTMIPEVVINPSGFAPLCALINVSTPVNGKIRITIVGKNGALSNVEHTSDNFDTQHEVPVLGLYANYENTVIIGFTNEAGQLRNEQELKITTDSLPDLFPQIFVDIRNEDKLEPGFTLFSYRGQVYNPNRPFMIDPFGDIRWVLNYQDHPTLANLGYDVGLERLKNGNFYFGDWSTNKVYEVDYYGEIINSWALPGYAFHHNVQEKPDGNLLVTSTKYGTMHLNGNYSTEDHILELDRQSGAIVMEWDLRESLDEYRIAHFNNLSAEYIDWFHANAVIYDERDNTIIVSGRLQGVVKLDYNNDVKWIMAPHQGWGENRKGEDLNQFLLTPLDAMGYSITQAGYLSGFQNHPDFEWNWAQHAPLIMPNGNLMIFDNGDRRNFTQSNPYSRAVEYQIDEANKTIQQVWQYGKERGSDTYSSITSDVDFLPNQNHILFSPGAYVHHSNGEFGAKVVEVDYASKEVVFEVRLVRPGIVFHRAEKLTIYPE